MKNPSCYPDYDYFCLAISAIVGNLFLIIIIGIPVLVGLFIWRWVKKEPEPKPEPPFEWGYLIFKIILGYIVIVVGFIFFEIVDTSIGYIVVEFPLKILAILMTDFIVPLFDWMLQEK